MDASKRANRATQHVNRDAFHRALAERALRAIGGRGGHDLHRLIAQVAGAQRSLVTRAQLLWLGMSSAAIGRAIRAGRLHAALPGVYSLVPLHSLPDLAREQAAVLAHAPGAVLSHGSAAALWGLQAPSAEIHVTVVGRHGGRPTEGLLIHSATVLDRRDTRQRHGLPVTAPARTILDLTPLLTNRRLEEVFDEGLHARIVRRTEVVAMLDRYPRRPGSSRLAALAHEDRATAWTRGDTEKRMKALLRKARLPFPEVNTEFGPYELDFFWREAGLVVETDGYEFQSTRRALENDHQRDLYLQARGLIVVRFSWRQVRDEPEMVLAQIAALLASRRAA